VLNIALRLPRSLQLGDNGYMAHRVLLVEDDERIRASMRLSLEDEGYDVDEVGTGEEAIELHARALTSNPFDLLVVDIMLPGMDGFECCRELRKASAVPIIMVTARTDTHDVVAGLEAGADDYLTKPYDGEELMARLRAGERILELEDHLVEARESMRYQATHDLLTSLWNRGVILELLSREIHRSHREKSCTVVMLCDIDHFKLVNDQHGHSAGDDVLQAVARRLRQAVRSYDMVGRYGGEEFLVILNKCDPASAALRAENIRGVISNKPIRTRSITLPLTISVGVALSTDFPNRGVDAIVEEADTALYAAKAAGRNCVRVAPPPPGANRELVLQAETSTLRT